MERGSQSFATRYQGAIRPSAVRPMTGRVGGLVAPNVFGREHAVKAKCRL